MQLALTQYDAAQLCQGEPLIFSDHDKLRQQLKSRGVKKLGHRERLIVALISGDDKAKPELKGTDNISQVAPK